MALDGKGAGADGQDDDGQSGSGAPEGGSPEGGSEKDALEEKFERRIKSALASQKQHHDREVAAVRAEFEALKSGVGARKDPPAEQPKRYTRADLRAAVTALQITQEQSDDIWDKQVKDEAKEAAVQAADEHVTRKTAKERIDADLATYKRLAPEVMEEGSEVREAIKREFQALVQSGMPGRDGQNLVTQLAAIKAVMGPLDKLEKARGARRQVEHDEQSGGSGGRRDNSGKSKVDQLDARKKSYYEQGIKSGRYKDWKAVEAELEFARR